LLDAVAVGVVTESALTFYDSYWSEGLCYQKENRG